MAKQQTNGKIKRLSAEELAELMVPATAKTPEEKEAALKRATTGLRAKVRVTRDEALLPRLRELLASEGIVTEIELRAITDNQAAQRERFLGRRRSA